MSHGKIGQINLKRFHPEFLSHSGPDHTYRKGQNPTSSAHLLISGPLHPLTTTCLVRSLMATVSFLRPLRSTMKGSSASVSRKCIRMTPKSPDNRRSVVICLVPPPLADWYTGSCCDGVREILYGTRGLDFGSRGSKEEVGNALAVSRPEEVSAERMSVAPGDVEDDGEVELVVTIASLLELGERKEAPVFLRVDGVVV